ncbi:AAA family ATPase [Niveibacterium sp. SC-1]|uniref:AAA family ATPase n=1 Tax=Niveibacterium sp. SC-1 TaxID=3135646 RepID=UPI00311E80F2
MIDRHFLSRVSLKREQIPDPERYPFNLPVVRVMDELLLHPKVTFFVGENGSGKSTLLEAIAVGLGFNPEGGSRNFRFGTRASHSVLHEYLRLARGVRRPRDGFFLRAESFFNVATEIERLDAEPAFSPPIGPAYGARGLHEQSHGESFLALLMERFGGNGLYLLDEPEAALSPQRQLAVLARLHALVQQESQFLIATHSPILMAYPDAWIYECGAGGLRRVAYEDTEHYQVTRDFLSHPQRMLAILLADPD